MHVAFWIGGFLGGIVADELRLETFSGQVGNQFLVTLGSDHKLALELIEAEPLRPDPCAPREDPFCLMFRGPVDASLPQGTYELTHETLGPFQLFLMPRQPDQNGSYYEVIIN